MGECDTSALSRNLALGKKHRVNGTPSIIFEDGKRIPGAMGAEAIEKQLIASRGK
jgi:thiol:disulfide interchange protein DsbC